MIGHLHLIVGGLPHVSWYYLAVRRQDEVGLTLHHLGTVPINAGGLVPAHCLVGATQAGRVVCLTTGVRRQRHTRVCAVGRWVRALRRVIAAGQEAGHNAPARHEEGPVVQRLPRGGNWSSRSPAR